MRESRQLVFLASVLCAVACAGSKHKGSTHAGQQGPGTALAANDGKRPDERRDQAPPLPLYGDLPRYRVPVGNSPLRGSKGAPITIVQFSDFECPFCALVVPTLERLLEEYEGQVQLHFRHNPMPFHAQALPAAEACFEAKAQKGDDGFWAMHDRLFAHQDALDAAALRTHAAAIGLDAKAFKAAMDDGRHRGKVAADQAVAMRLNAMATPWQFINGRSIAGALPYEEFRQTVDQELRLAKRLMQDGVAKEQLYDRVLASASESIEEDAR